MLHSHRMRGFSFASRVDHARRIFADENDRKLRSASVFLFERSHALFDLFANGLSNGFGEEQQRRWHITELIKRQYGVCRLVS